jgi:hypothetical protein
MAEKFAASRLRTNVGGKGTRTLGPNPIPDPMLIPAPTCIGATMIYFPFYMSYLL